MNEVEGAVRARRQGERLGDGARRADLVPVQGEQVGHRLGGIGVVLDQQNPQILDFGFWILDFRLADVRELGDHAVARQGEGEGGPLLQPRARGGQRAAVHLGDRLADGEAETQPAGPARAACPPLLEGVENVRHRRGIDADAGVGDLNSRLPGPDHDRTVIVPPTGVNLTALLSRFQSTWVRREGSAQRRWSSADSSAFTRRRPAATSRSQQISIVCSTTLRASVTSRRRSSLPRVMRVRSSRSSISRASSSTLRRIMSSGRRSSAGRRSSPARPEATSSTGVSGVRSSWLRVARKWSFASLAASASARASLSRSSSRARSSSA